MNLKSENSSVGWMGPSSLVRHILALRHRKYELYAPMKMQTEPYKKIQLANRLSWSAKKGQTWPWQTCSTNWINEDVCRYFVPRYTFDWILLIAFKRVGVAISQLVKFNLQDLQLMNNIEENIASEGASPSNPLWTWTIRYGIAIRQHWHRRGIQETTTDGHDLGQTL